MEGAHGATDRVRAKRGRHVELDLVVADSHRVVGGEPDSEGDGRNSARRGTNLRAGWSARRWLMVGCPGALRLAPRGFSFVSSGSSPSSPRRRMMILISSTYSGG